MTNREKYPSVDDRALAFLKSEEFLSLKEAQPYELVSMAFAWEHLSSCSCELNGKNFIESNGKRYELSEVCKGNPNIEKILNLSLMLKIAMEEESSADKIAHEAFRKRKEIEDELSKTVKESFKEDGFNGKSIDPILHKDSKCQHNKSSRQV